MFWVHNVLTDEDILVYSVKPTKMGAEFLIYDKDGWGWILSRYCEPLESTLM